MKRHIAIALATAGLMTVAAAPAHAGGHVSLSLGVGLPIAGYGYAAPVYGPSYAPTYYGPPAPVYVAPRVYVPAPVYYGYPGPRYYGPRHYGPRVVYRPYGRGWQR